MGVHRADEVENKVPETKCVRKFNKTTPQVSWISRCNAYAQITAEFCKKLYRNVLMLDVTLLCFDTFSCLQSVSLKNSSTSRLKSVAAVGAKQVVTGPGRIKEQPWPS
jgi:hypothetical protein